MKFKFDGQRMYEITSGFHEKESFRNFAHNGIDLRISVGTPLYSPVEGKIIDTTDYGNTNIGKGILIETEDHQTVVLGHLSKINVREGDKVHMGDFVGESGNTGHVVGNGHLHIGLKDSQGHFINPSKIEENFQLVAKEMGDSGHHHLGILGLGLSKMNDDRGFMDYIHDLKAEGFFYATFGKTMKDMILDSLKDLWYMILDGLKHGLHFVLENDEGFLIIPAVVIIFATFLIGRNKFSKWIIPLWLAYFVSSVLTHTSGLMDWLGK